MYVKLHNYAHILKIVIILNQKKYWLSTRISCKSRLSTRPRFEFWL